MGLRPEDIVSETYEGKYVFIHNKKEILDLRYIQEEFKRTHRGEHGNELDRPVIMTGADGVTPTLMVADNETDPQEVQDILGETLEKQEKQVQESSETSKAPAMDTDWIRYVNHLPIDIKQRRTMISEAIHERMRHHKENPVSDPARDPWSYAREQGMLPPQIQVPENYSVTTDETE